MKTASIFKNCTDAAMTAVSPGSTNQVVMGAANSHTTTAAASPAMRLSTVALRTPSFTRSSLPAPAFCAVKVAAASPKVNVGCVVSCSTLEPKPLMVTCKIMQPMAVTLLDSAVGMPIRARRRTIGPCQAQSARPVRRMGNFFSI